MNHLCVDEGCDHYGVPHECFTPELFAEYREGNRLIKLANGSTVIFREYEDAKPFVSEGCPHGLRLDCSDCEEVR